MCLIASFKCTLNTMDDRHHLTHIKTVVLHQPDDIHEDVLTLNRTYLIENNRKELTQNLIDAPSFSLSTASKVVCTFMSHSAQLKPNVCLCSTPQQQ